MNINLNCLKDAFACMHFISARLQIFAHVLRRSARLQIFARALRRSDSPPEQVSK